MKSTINARVIFTTAILSTVLLVVVLVGVEAWYRWQERGEEREYDSAKSTWLEDSREAQRARMARAPISIDEAMRRVVAGERATTRKAGT